MSAWRVRTILSSFLRWVGAPVTRISGLKKNHLQVQTDSCAACWSFHCTCRNEHNNPLESSSSCAFFFWKAIPCHWHLLIHPPRPSHISLLSATACRSRYQSLCLHYYCVSSCSCRNCMWLTPHPLMIPISLRRCDQHLSMPSPSISSKSTWSQGL